MKARALAKFCLDAVLRSHGVPGDIVSDQDHKFTGNVWSALSTHIGVKLSMSTAFHPKTDGQTERDNCILESISEMM